MIHSHNSQADTPSSSEPWTPSAPSPGASTLDTATRAKNLVRDTSAEASMLANEGVHRLSHSARELARDTLSKISHQARLTQNQLGSYAGEATRYMSDHPLRAASFSLFLGFLMAQAVRGFRTARSH